MKPYRRVELSTLPDQREISDIIKEFKKSVVCFDAWGFPDFLSFTKNVGNISCKVLIDVTGDFNTDAKRANAELKAKLTGTPFANISTFNGQNNIFGDKITYTWHHDQDSQHMLLVPTMLNTNNKPNLEHLGGSAIIKKGLKNSFPSSVKLNCN
ncbi:HNH endonuclease [Runella limosa]|uniref:HNH endonuclease n=1 Tax=Runella limosa TaxID=370978 RepID=UPI00146F9B62|nr:HNH endonuclease [Runella limosa]